MSRNSPRTSLMVSVMDTEAVKPLLDVVYRALYNEEPPPVYTVDEAVIAKAMTKEYGVQPVLICTEGVGWEVDNGNCLDIPCRTPRSMVGFTLPLHWERIPLREEQVNFAEFVRRFGDRLESNWRLWNDAISKAQAREDKGAKGAKRGTA